MVGGGATRQHVEQCALPSPASTAHRGRTNAHAVAVHHKGIQRRLACLIGAPTKADCAVALAALGRRAARLHGIDGAAAAGQGDKRRCCGAAEALACPRADHDWRCGGLLRCCRLRVELWLRPRRRQQRRQQRERQAAQGPLHRRGGSATRRAGAGGGRRRPQDSASAVASSAVCPGREGSAGAAGGPPAAAAAGASAGRAGAKRLCCAAA